MLRAGKTWRDRHATERRNHFPTPTEFISAERMIPHYSTALGL